MKVKASMGRLLKKRLASFPPLWVATTPTKVVDKRRVVGSRLLKLQPLSPLRLQVNFLFFATQNDPIWCKTG